jgi:hypothetical protein
MSTDIRQHIKEMAEFHQSNRQPVELHEVEVMVSTSAKPMTGRNLRGLALGVAVMVAVLLVFGGLALLVSTNQATPPADTVTPTTLVAPTTAPPSPTTTPVQGSSLGAVDLAWERIEPGEIPSEIGFGPLNSTVLDGGDRFVLLRGAEALTGIATSFDGVSWVTQPFQETVGETVMGVAWEDTVLVAAGGGRWSREEDGGPAFSIPSVVSVVHPDGRVQRRVFDGDVQSLAIGPTGMFATLTPHASYGYVIDQILGSEFSGTLYEAEVRDGVLVVERAVDGQTAEIVLSEHGLTEEDLNSPVASWYSQSGSEWTPVPDTPPGLSVIGTRDGFVGVTGTIAWHSEDGAEWNRLGDLPFTPDPWQFSQIPMRWRQGAVATNGSIYAYISADGIELLPDPPMVPASIDRSPPHYLSGDLGVVIVNPFASELLFTQDGENWEVGTLPDEMTDSFGWYTSSGAVTNDAVLLLLWEEETPGGVQRPAWWVGTPSDK